MGSVAGPAPYRQVAGAAWTRDHLVGNVDTFVDTIVHSPSVPKGTGRIAIHRNSSAAFATICPEPSAHSQRATETIGITQGANAADGFLELKAWFFRALIRKYERWGYLSIARERRFLSETLRISMGSSLLRISI